MTIDMNAGIKYMLKRSYYQEDYNNNFHESRSHNKREKLLLQKCITMEFIANFSIVNLICSIAVIKFQ